MNAVLSLGFLFSALLVAPPGREASPYAVSSGTMPSGGFAIRMETFNPPGSPARSEAFGRAGVAFHRGDFTAALAILERDLKAASDDPEVLNLHGAILTQMKRFGEARPLFQKVLVSRPGHFWARFNMAELDWLEGRGESARKQFEAMKGMQPDWDELLELKIVLILLAEKRADEARTRAEALPEACHSAAGYALRAAVAYHAGNQDMARKWIALAEASYPGQMQGFLRATLEEAGLPEAVLGKK